MAKNVIAQVIGGDKKVLDDVSTVGDVKKSLSAEGYVASLNGEPAGDDAQVRDSDFITFAKATKGGC